MNETIELVYDDLTGSYVQPHYLMPLPKEEKGEFKGFNPQYYDTKEGSFFIKNMIRLSPLIACVVLTSFLPLALYVPPLLSVAMNPNKVGTYPAQKGRRRKGRTNLPLKDVTTGYMSTKCNE